MAGLTLHDPVELLGIGTAELFDLDGNLLEATTFENLVTRYGDQFYAERGANIGANAAATGMQLGTGSTAAAKTGAGASIGAYVTGTSIGFVSTYPRSTLVGTTRQIEWRAEWGPGVGTNGALREAAIINQALGTDAAAPSGSTIARTRFAASLNKVAASVLLITWRHLLEGA